MHFKVYDIFYSLNSHQHVSAAIAAIFRVLIFLNPLLTSMFHYKIAILHAKSFLLQSLVTVINTVYIH
jgi:hypothetical protein